MTYKKRLIIGNIILAILIIGTVGYTNQKDQNSKQVNPASQSAELYQTPRITPNDYPVKWANIAPNSVRDDWGFLNRTCASYVAYKLHNNYGIEASLNWGGYWDKYAASHGVVVDSTPAIGSVMFQGDRSDGFTHVSWVDSLKEVSLGNGEKQTLIHVSQYDGKILGEPSENQRQGTGNYMELDYTPGTLKFIHFEQVTDPSTLN